MVCSKCKIKGHNVRTCISLTKIESRIKIIKILKSNLLKIHESKLRDTKINKMIHLFEFLHTNSWFVHTNTFFNITAINKMNNLIQNGFPIDLAHKYLSKYIKCENRYNVKECPICFESFSNKQPFDTICGHTFCVPCLTSHLKYTKNCPTCRHDFNE